MSESVLLEVRDGVATLTLNRPDVLNALDASMATALASASAKVAADAAVRCIVVTGAGGNFMAGGDIGVFHRWLDEPPERRQAAIRRVLGPVHDGIRNLRAAPQPVVAGVRGACAGFGLSLMMACELAVVGEGATLSLAYCRIGASPDGGSTYALPRLVGMKRAMEVALLGERFTAADALGMGLANRVVPDEDVARVTADLARRLARGPARTLARTKALLQRSWGNDLEAQLEAEEACFLEGVAGTEFEEGVRAFVEKRPPAW